jgi:hypothetical protein
MSGKESTKVWVILNFLENQFTLFHFFDIEIHPYGQNLLLEKVHMGI